MAMDDNGNKREQRMAMAMTRNDNGNGAIERSMSTSFVVMGCRREERNFFSSILCLLLLFSFLLEL